MDKEISQCREDVSVATFPEEVELNSELKISHSTDRDALVRTDPNSTTLPGQPRIGLDITSITNYLVEDLLTPELDRLAPKLWLVCCVYSCPYCLNKKLTFGRFLLRQALTSHHCITKLFEADPSSLLKTLSCTLFGLTNRSSSNRYQNTCCLMPSGNFTSQTTRRSYQSSSRSGYSKQRSALCGHTVT